MADERDELRVIESLRELEEIVRQRPTSYVRYSNGPAHDAQEQSIDTESGLALPGLSVNPLHQERWWTRPLTDWLARQVCQYQELQEANPERFAWILDGRVIARGPDCEPLLVDIEAIGRLTPDILAEAETRYHERFDAGRGPES